MCEISNEVYKGYNIKIVYDECPTSPREWDNIGEFAFPRESWHSRLNTGASLDYLAIEAALWECESWAEQEELYRRKCAYIPIPLYIVDHGETRIYTTPKNSHWAVDGWYICAPEKMVREGLDAAKAKAVMLAELETFEKYINGEVFGFMVSKDGDLVDCCYGYYSVEDAKADAITSIEYAIAIEAKKAIAEQEAIEAQYMDGSLAC